MSSKDLEFLLSTRHDNGSDFWATPEGKIGVGGPFGTMAALTIMSELEVPSTHEAVIGAASLVIQAIRDDGRARIAPKGAIYPCHTAAAAAALCRNGFAQHPRVVLMLKYLLENRYEDGGWRCNKFIWGKGPETEHSNPGVTLWALDAFRCAGYNNKETSLDSAVETLLDHWTVRSPTGPCHFGIGTQYMKVEYPFLRYNLFYTTYVLSFYDVAKSDPRFLEMLDALCKKLDGQGRLIVERPNAKLAKLDFCKAGQPSEVATRRYQEILLNLEK